MLVYPGIGKGPLTVIAQVSVTAITDGILDNKLSTETRTSRFLNKLLALICIKYCTG